MDKDSPLQKEWGSPDLLHHEGGLKCSAVSPLQGKIFGTLEDAAAFPLRWLNTVGGAVLEHSIGDAATATFADKPHTFPGVTVVQIATLPPDACTTSGDSNAHLVTGPSHACVHRHE